MKSWKRICASANARRRACAGSLHFQIQMRSPFLPLFVASLLAGCHRPPAPKPREAERVSTFAAAGVVRKVDAERRKAVIAHETIAGFMEAMTMEFDVASGEPLADLRAGDAVAFRLSVNETRSWIDQVRKTGRASEVATFPQGGESLAAGDLLPDGALMDQRGVAFHLADFKGRALAITFIFTRCPLPDFCPLMNRNFAEVRRELSSDAAHSNWHLLSISFDPEYDTPARLAEYAKPYEIENGHWSFATGATEDIQKLGDAFGLTVARNGAQIDHTLRTVVIDATGRVQKIFIGNGWSASELTDEMRRAMDAKP